MFISKDVPEKVQDVFLALPGTVTYNLTSFLTLDHWKNIEDDESLFARKDEWISLMWFVTLGF